MIGLFFFSSRRRHTRSKRDWSSDVCSSDLGIVSADGRACSEQIINQCERWRIAHVVSLRLESQSPQGDMQAAQIVAERLSRSEERRVGKECRSRWAA